MSQTQQHRGKMKNQHENTILIFLGILATISLITSLLLSYKPETLTGTGYVTGSVNITINESIAITLVRNTINFTTSNPGDGRTTYTTADIATAPIPSCTAKLNTATCGFNISNDGSVTINITLQDLRTLFTSPTFSRATHFLFNVSVPNAVRARTTGICPGFYNLTTAPAGNGNNWTAVPTTATTIICGLNFTNSDSGNAGPDVAAIDINITVPLDEGSGTKGTILEFLASRAGL